MKTSSKTKKTFDAVAFMRKRRNEISKEISEMTPQEEIKYFQQKAKKITEEREGKES